MTWYPIDRDRDYTSVMIAWVRQLVNSPAVFPVYTWNARQLVRDCIPYMDAHVRREEGINVFKTANGTDFLGFMDKNEFALVAGQAAYRIVRDTVQNPTNKVVTWHGADACVPGAVCQPWRMFTTCPARYSSKVAYRRQAKIIVACEELGLL